MSYLRDRKVLTNAEDGRTKGGVCQEELRIRSQKGTAEFDDKIINDCGDISAGDLAIDDWPGIEHPWVLPGNPLDRDEQTTRGGIEEDV